MREYNLAMSNMIKSLNFFSQTASPYLDPTYPLIDLWIFSLFVKNVLG